MLLAIGVSGLDADFAVLQQRQAYLERTYSLTLICAGIYPKRFDFRF